MDRILLILCNGLSCFIISTILFQFMNGKYKRSSKNRYIYIIAETLTVLLIVGINILNIPILNLLAWIMVVFIVSLFLYYEDTDKPLRRIMETEALVFCLCICESFGAVLMRWILQLIGATNINNTMN